VQVYRRLKRVNLGCLVQLNSTTWAMVPHLELSANEQLNLNKHKNTYLVNDPKKINQQSISSSNDVFLHLVQIIFLIFLYIC